MRQPATCRSRLGPAGGAKTEDAPEVGSVRILIAEDHPQLRGAMRKHLSDRFPRAKIGEVDNGLEALRQIGRQEWDLVVLDINMPGVSGLEVMKILRAARPELPVVVLSMDAEEPYAARALADGAAGYVAKDTTTGELITAIVSVLAGRKYVSTSVARRLASRSQASPQPPLHPELSGRE